jgi:hypothetical protein
MRTCALDHTDGDDKPIWTGRARLVAWAWWTLSYPRVWLRAQAFEHGRRHMADINAVREHMKVIGADGVHIGTVDRLDGNRIKLTKQDSGQGSHEGHHHYIPTALIAEIEGDTVRLSANANVAVTFEEEADGNP